MVSSKNKAHDDSYVQGQRMGRDQNERADYESENRRLRRKNEKKQDQIQDLEKRLYSAEMARQNAAEQSARLNNALHQAQTEIERLVKVEDLWNRLHPFAEFLCANQSEQQRRVNQANRVLETQADLEDEVKTLRAALKNQDKPQEDYVTMRAKNDVLETQLKDMMRKYRDLEISNERQTHQLQHKIDQLGTIQDAYRDLENSKDEQSGQLREAEEKHRNTEEMLKEEIYLLEKIGKEPKLSKSYVYPSPR